jgi:hypothetical protein
MNASIGIGFGYRSEIYFQQAFLLLVRTHFFAARAIYDLHLVTDIAQSLAIKVIREVTISK